MTTWTLGEVVDRLSEFKHPDEIAAQFAILGIRGVLEDPCNCALARMADATVYSDLFEDGEEDDGCMIYRPGFSRFVGDEHPLEEVRMPRVAESFMIRFDAGNYPELIEGP